MMTGSLSISRVDRDAEGAYCASWCAVLRGVPVRPLCSQHALMRTRRAIGRPTGTAARLFGADAAVLSLPPPTPVAGSVS